MTLKLRGKDISIRRYIRCDCLAGLEVVGDSCLGDNHLGKGK